MASLVKETIPESMLEGVGDDPMKMLQLMSEVLGKDTTEINQKINHGMADLCSDQSFLRRD